MIKEIGSTMPRKSLTKALWGFGRRNVRFGSKADMRGFNRDVRFTPESGHSLTRVHVRFGPKLTNCAAAESRSPRPNPIFLGIIAVHVAFGLAAVIAGAIAMLSKKGRGRHSNFGLTYFWCLFGVFVTMSSLAFTRWQEDYDLFILGTLSFGAAWLSRAILRHNILL